MCWLTWKAIQNHRSEVEPRSEDLVHLRETLFRLQAELDAAYDIVSEMDFDLDDVYLLEIQNQWLRDELKELKANAETEGGEVYVAHRNRKERPSARHKRRIYRQQVACGMLGQSLKELALERRYARQWDGSIIGELFRCQLEASDK
ncbi:uncharacterized protein LOC117902628 [Drosophila subobscura]|uniref:uncharacterized protein LOC117902628 n=1 Tax=Drosophila subobscura TaxID=7241 RepID=UPI00155A426D|nr:uncharacterized protein LOC117902628 [Drosophila subobscura]